MSSLQLGPMPVRYPEAHQLISSRERGPDGHPLYWFHAQLCGCTQCDGDQWQTDEVIKRHEEEDEERAKRAAEVKQERDQARARRAQKKEEEVRKRELESEQEVEKMVGSKPEAGAYCSVVSALKTLTRRSYPSSQIVMRLGRRRSAKFAKTMQHLSLHEPKPTLHQPRHGTPRSPSSVPISRPLLRRSPTVVQMRSSPNPLPRLRPLLRSPHIPMSRRRRAKHSLQILPRHCRAPHPPAQRVT